MAMKGSSASRLLRDHSGIDDQPGGDVLAEDQNGVDRQERLRQDEPAVGAVVERPFQPLRGRRGCGSRSRLITNRASEQIRSHRIGFRL